MNLSDGLKQPWLHFNPQWNGCDSVSVKNLTTEQVSGLVAEITNSFNINVPDFVTQDIFDRTSGHPSLTCRLFSEICQTFD